MLVFKSGEGAEALPKRNNIQIQSDLRNLRRKKELRLNGRIRNQKDLHFNQVALSSLMPLE